MNLKIEIDLSHLNNRRYLREKKRRNQGKFCNDCNQQYTKGTFYNHKHTLKHQRNVMTNMAKFVDENEEDIFQMDEIKK
jgi:hypothetical protein